VTFDTSIDFQQGCQQDLGHGQRPRIGSVTQIVSIINEVSDIVSGLAAAFEEQNATTREITDNLAQAAQGIEEVNQNVIQSSTVAGAISGDISEVSDSAREMNDNGVLVEQSAQDLSRLSERLKDVVGRFKTEAS
jgi:methyl-accepting chemotaxis protein